MNATRRRRDPDIDVDLTGFKDAEVIRQPEPEPGPEPETEPEPEPVGPSRGRRILEHLKAATGLAKVLARQPISAADAWQRSRDVDLKRIPARNDFLAMICLLSARTDRILWFALYCITPAPLAGAVLYIAERPTRRWGATLVLLIVLVLVPLAVA